MKKLNIDNSIAIQVENISKAFFIPHENDNTLKNLFTNIFKIKGHFKYDRFEALKNVNLTVPKGQVLGIIGKNGSGKSTLLKLIVGIYAVDSGKVFVNGRIVPFLELGVGFNSELTARENIFLNGTILGMTRNEIKSCFESIVDFAEIREFLDMPVKKFSSGMLVRLAFSIAIQAKGDIYILDEVLAVGDAKFQEKSKKEMLKLKENKNTVIFVSHNLESIKEFCDRVICISDGSIIEKDNKEETIDYYLKSVT